MNVNDPLDITVPGMTGYNYKDATEVCEIDKRTMIRDLMAALTAGDVSMRDFTFWHTGDTMMLGIIDPKTGEREIYDLRVRAVYHESSR
jgi:hypothetical protein